MRFNSLFLIGLLGIAGCNVEKPLADVKTAGDLSKAPNYGYTPIDPLPAYLQDTAIGNPRLVLHFLGNSSYASLLSEETMRMAIGTVDAKANISFASNTLGVAGNSYVVILDYIKYVSLPMLANAIDSAGTKTITNVYLLQTTPSGSTSGQQVVMPLYVGVGLRITANVTVKSGSLSLGNLFGIGASASLNQTSGTLTVQTLGITGDGISSLIPIPSELNTTTIQNAILSLGAIKAKMYEPATILSPRVIGFYNNVGGIGTVITNKLISNVLTKNIVVPSIGPKL